MATKKTEEEIRQEMAANSAAWHTADAETRKQLEAANQALGAQLGASFNSGTGTWSDASGASLYGSAAAAKNTGNTSGYSPTGGAGTLNQGFNGSANSVNTYGSGQDAIRAQMNANSIAWHTADAAEKKRLEAENKALAAQLGGTVAFDPTTGYWSGDAAQKYPTFSYNADMPTYDSAYSGRIDALLDQILNREDFSYNAEADPLYQQYRTQYNREGNRAMNDTLAAAASGAGGMNSYAVTAAQQANDYYAAQLGDKIPELYQLAYSMYLQDIDNQVQDLGLLQQMDDTQYSRYRDTMSDWRNDRDFAYNQYRDAMGDYQWNTSFDYNAGRDQIADDRYNREWEYNVGRDQVADSRYENETAYDRAMQMLTSGVMPDSAVLSSAGISSAEASALMEAAKAAAKKSSSGGGSGRSSGGSSGSSSGGSMDYEGLFQAAMDSGNPQSFLAQKANYQKYGFTSSSGLFSDYKNWLESSGYNASARARKIASNLEQMRGQMGSKDAIANSIAVTVDREGLSDGDARFLFKYFGYDPDEWME